MGSSRSRPYRKMEPPSAMGCSLGSQPIRKAVVLDECGNIHHWLRAGEITPTALTPEGTARVLAALLPGGLQLEDDAGQIQQG